MLTPHQKAELEALIDRDSLASVLGEIAMICSDKAAHIQSYDQAGSDRGLIRAWRTMAKDIENSSDRAARLIGP